MVMTRSTSTTKSHLETALTRNHDQWAHSRTGSQGSREQVGEAKSLRSSGEPKNMAGTFSGVSYKMVQSLSYGMRMSKTSSLFRRIMLYKVKQASEYSSYAPQDAATLDARLESVGSRTMRICGDGNCQFRSFAFNLFGDQNHHAATRKAAVAHMKKHSAFFGVLFEDSGRFKTYLHDMAQDATWGDELTMLAIVEAYGCIAHVITSEPQNWYLVYEPHDTNAFDPNNAICPKGHAMPPKGKQVFLTYVSPIHYNAVVASSHAHKEHLAPPTALLT